MQNEAGKNTYRKQFIQYLDKSKDHFNNSNFNISAKYIYPCIAVIKNTNHIIDVLEMEKLCLNIFDRNSINNNISNIDGRLLSCQTALEEYNLFTNDKEKYLKRFIDSYIKDIRSDSIFERMTKDIYSYLGREKRNSISLDFVRDFFDARQQKMYEIKVNFKKDRIAFLEKHSNNLKHMEKEKNKKMSL